MDGLVGGLLLLLIVAATFGWMFGGQKMAGRIFAAPFRFVAGLLRDFIQGVMNFTCDIFGHLMRALGRLIDRGFRRLFGLPPRRERWRRREERDQEDDEV